MNLVTLEYCPIMDDIKETCIMRGIPVETALNELKTCSFPAYIYEPSLVNTDSFFLMYVENTRCKKERNKIKNP